ncbi:MAG: gamma-glutamyl-gamma-aminobutyrate hydrolase family protein [Thermoleophilaceae bacterium]
MSRPVIGIGAAIEQARWGAWDSLVLLSPRTYSLAVQREGAIAVVLSPDDAVADDPSDLLDLLDGLLLAGGSDIDPATYGTDVRPETTPALPGRDDFEVALTRAALERDIPVLGVCRGMQLLNVALGGTLDQHIANLQTHRHTRGAFHDHEVVLEPGSLAAKAEGTERLAVSSHHHQGIGDLGTGLRVSGRAVGDDLVEAIELPDRRFALGVLWHPEQKEGSGVIAALVEAAAARAG